MPNKEPSSFRRRFAQGLFSFRNEKRAAGSDASTRGEEQQRGSAGGTRQAGKDRRRIKASGKGSAALQVQPIGHFSAVVTDNRVIFRRTKDYSFDRDRGWLDINF